MMKRQKKECKRTVLSLYSGAGGLDLGLEAAGFKVALCVEMDSYCRSTLKMNRPDWRLSEPGDAHGLTTEQAMLQAGLQPGEVTLIAGGPPCQPFSKSSYWARGDSRRLNDPRSATLNRYLDFVEVAQPRAFLLENVQGLVFNGKDEGLQLLRSRLKQINRRHKTGYDLSIITLNCADFGVPQIRERVFIIADREGNLLLPPDPTHHPLTDEHHQDADKYRTAWDAIGDLDDEYWPENLNLRGKWANLLPSVPEGENYLWHTSRRGGEPLFGWRTRYWSFLLKLAKNRPSWTIQAAPGPATGPFHWRSRQLSTRELCRLQTFPDDFSVAGEYADQHRQIGNAVPPAIGEMLGREIRRQLLGERPRHSTCFVPSARNDCPSPEPVLPVAREYWHQRGDHDEHPGTGQGPAAIRRKANTFENGV